MSAYNATASFKSLFEAIHSRLFALETMQRIPQFTTATLPDAAAHEGVIAYDTTTNTMKFSNGSTWNAL